MTAVLTIYPATLPRSENGFETADGADDWNLVFAAGNGDDDDAVVSRPVELDTSVECSRNSWLQIVASEGSDDTFVAEERTRDDTSVDVVAVVVDEKAEEVVVVEQRRKQRKDGQEDTIEIDAARSSRR